MEEKKHFIYVILTQNNKLYCGYTNDVLARYKKHVEGKGAKFTPKELDSIPYFIMTYNILIVLFL